MQVDNDNVNDNMLNQSTLLIANRNADDPCDKTKLLGDWKTAKVPDNLAIIQCS